jgi:hypothetical protein
MKPYFIFPEDETEAVKEIQKQMLSKYKEIFKGHQQKADQQFIKAFFESSVVVKQDA